MHKHIIFTYLQSYLCFVWIPVVSVILRQTGTAGCPTPCLSHSNAWPFRYPQIIFWLLSLSSTQNRKMIHPHKSALHLAARSAATSPGYGLLLDPDASWWITRRPGWMIHLTPPTLFCAVFSYLCHWSVIFTAYLLPHLDCTFHTFCVPENAHTCDFLTYASSSYCSGFTHGTCSPHCNNLSHSFLFSTGSQLTWLVLKLIKKECVKLADRLLR